MQSYLMPPSPTEWLPAGHLVYFLLDVVETLSIGEVERAIAAKDARGERPYPPRLMVALLLYGYSTGVVSSRAIARATHEDVAFRVIAGNAHPAFTTINQFRLDPITLRQFINHQAGCVRAHSPLAHRPQDHRNI